MSGLFDLRILLADDLAFTDAFEAELRAKEPDVDLYRWPSLPDDGHFDVLLAWCLPDGLGRLPDSLAFVFCFGAGADQLLSDPRIPTRVPIARLVDENQAAQIADYAAHVGFARLLDQVTVKEDQARALWSEADGPRRTRDQLRVAVLGLGHIGARVASELARLGFSVQGWSRSHKSVPGVETFAGEDGLVTAVEAADVLINLLPLTAETEDILSQKLFARLSSGAYVANLGRGGHLDEAALLGALESGRVGAAWLDAFRQEPLAPDHRFWSHPRITITPHLAGIPTANGAANSLADCIDAFRRGLPLPNLVRPGRI